MQTRVNFFAGDADVDHTQIIEGDTVKLLGGYIPPSPPSFGTLCTLSIIIEILA